MTYKLARNVLDESGKEVVAEEITTGSKAKAEYVLAGWARNPTTVKVTYDFIVKEEVVSRILWVKPDWLKQVKGD